MRPVALTLVDKDLHLAARITEAETTRRDHGLKLLLAERTPFNTTAVEHLRSVIESDHTVLLAARAALGEAVMARLLDLHRHGTLPETTAEELGWPRSVSLAGGTRTVAPGCLAGPAWAKRDRDVEVMRTKSTSTPKE